MKKPATSKPGGLLSRAGDMPLAPLRPPSGGGALVSAPLCLVRYKAYASIAAAPMPRLPIFIAISGCSKSHPANARVQAPLAPPPGVPAAAGAAHQQQPPPPAVDLLGLGSDTLQASLPAVVSSNDESSWATFD